MKFAWFNNRLLLAKDLAINHADRGFLLGDGVFETMRLTSGYIPLITAHLDRLAAGADLLQIPLPNQPMLVTAIKTLITANNQKAGSLRLTLTRGPGPRGVLPPADPTPSLLITQASPAPPMGPCRLHLSRYRRDGTSPLNRIKHLNYLPQILSRIEAQQAGYDDAVLLAQDGHHIAEASASNLVVLLQGRLHTPPCGDGALSGVSRARLLESGLCAQTRLTVAHLESAEAAWLTNSLSLRRVDCFLNTAIPDHPEWTDRIKRCLFQTAC